MRWLTEGLAKKRSVIGSEPGWRDPPGPSEDLCLFILVVDVWSRPQSVASSLRTTHMLMF